MVVLMNKAFARSLAPLSPIPFERKSNLASFVFCFKEAANAAAPSSPISLLHKSSTCNPLFVPSTHANSIAPESGNGAT